MNIFDAKSRVLVRNACQLLKLKVNQNSRVTSDLTSSEDPMGNFNSHGFFWGDLHT